MKISGRSQLKTLLSLTQELKSNGGSRLTVPSEIGEARIHPLFFALIQFYFHDLPQ